ELLGLSPGDAIELGDAQVRLVATWRVRDALDPQWMGDPLLLSGVGDDIGPIVVDEPVWHEMGVTPAVRWTAIPDASQLTPEDLPVITAASDDRRSAVRNASDAELGSPRAQDRLGSTAAAVQEIVNAVRAVEPVERLSGAATALVALLEVARMLGSTRA